jgi:hypothetical protein
MRSLANFGSSRRPIVPAALRRRFGMNLVTSGFNLDEAIGFSQREVDPNFRAAYAKKDSFKDGRHGLSYHWITWLIRHKLKLPFLAKFTHDFCSHRRTSGGKAACSKSTRGGTLWNSLLKQTLYILATAWSLFGHNFGVLARVINEVNEHVHLRTRLWEIR